MNIRLVILFFAGVGLVAGGENAGRQLQHVAVVRSLTRIGTVDSSSEFSRDFDLKSKNHANLRLVVIVQEPDAGRVLGVGLTRLANQDGQPVAR